MSTNLSRRSFGLLSAGLAAGLGLASCSGGGGGSSTRNGAKKVVWSTWGSPEDLKSFDRWQAAFKEKHTDIEVIFQPTPSYDDYHSKLLTQLSSNTAPDVFYIGDDRVASIIRNKVLAPIENMGVKESDFADSLLGIARFEDKLYALPNDVNPDTLWYDKQALTAAGIKDDPAELAANDQWTLDAFFEMTKALHAAGLTGAVYWNYWATHDGFMTASGGQVYDNGKFVAHEDPKSVSALQAYADRFQAGEFKLADLLPEGSGEDTMLVTHKLGFLAAGRYTIGSIKGAGVEQDDYDIVRWPTPDGKAAPTGVAASYLAINAKAQNMEAASTFFSEFLNAEGQKLRLEDTGNAVPSINGADDIVLSSGYPKHAQTMLDMRDIGYSNFMEEAAVPDLSNTIAVEYMQPLYQGKEKDAQATLNAVANLVEEKIS